MSAGVIRPAPSWAEPGAGATGAAVEPVAVVLGAEAGGRADRVSLPWDTAAPMPAPRSAMAAASTATFDFLIALRKVAACSGYLASAWTVESGDTPRARDEDR